MLIIDEQKEGSERIYNSEDVPTNVHAEASPPVPSRISQNSLKTTSDWLQ